MVDGAAASAGMQVRADRAAAGENPYRVFRTGTQRFMRTFLHSQVAQQNQREDLP